MIRSLLIGSLCLLMVGPVNGQSDNLRDLRRQQQVQERAQSLTRQLVSQVLDLQASQLRQNGLTEAPIYQDIEQMSNNLDELIQNEMQGVVKYLVDAQQQTGDGRLASLRNAREEVRKVMLTLMAERQRLYRRLRLAKLHALVRELITKQESITLATRQLPQLPEDSRDESVLASTSNQADTETLFQHLEFVLMDIRGWGGSLASSAISAQQVLETEGAPDAVASAVAALRTARFDEAVQHQVRFTTALYKILDDLEQAQGLADRNLESTVQAIEKMKQDQQQLRNETKQSDLSPDSADLLSQKQERIQATLEKMADQAKTEKSQNAPLENATEAAQQAVAELFEGDKDDALAQQDEVLEQLDQLSDQIKQMSTIPQDLSADERREEIAALEEAQEELAAALEKQVEAEANHRQQPEETSQLAKDFDQSSEQIDKALQTENLPQSVKPMIADAKSQATKAATTAKQQPDDRPAETQQAVRKAKSATEQALENVASELADSKRRQLATQIGELARAAEALDRAAAAQQEVARQAAKLANNPENDTPESRKSMATTQKDIQAVADRAAEGTKQTAPAAAKSLAEAKQATETASKQAQKLASSQNNPDSNAKQARKLHDDSRSAQKSLSNAAKALREEAKKAAMQLADTAGDQLDQIDSVDSALQDTKSQTADASDQAPSSAPSLDQLAHQAGMISPEAAAQIRQATTPANTSLPQDGGTQPQTDSPAANDTTKSAVKSPEKAVQQARAELAGRRQPIAEDQQAAQQLASLLEDISGAGEKIQELSEKLASTTNQAKAASAESNPMPNAATGNESPMENPIGDSPMHSGTSADLAAESSEIARQLANSMRKFAGSQREATQLASQAAQQRDIANQPVRDALQTASRLPVPNITPPTAEATAAEMSGDASPMNAESPNASEMASAESSPESSAAASGSPAGSQSPASGSPPPSTPSTEMGNSVVSQTPQITAQALAGEEAMETLWDHLPELLADANSEGQQVATIDPLGMSAPASAMLDNPTSQQPSSPTDALAQNSEQSTGASSQESSTPPGASDQATDSSESNPDQSPAASGTSNSNPDARSFERKPWFTKLPPGVQNSIRASVRRNPPPGYEERLRRYFQSVN